MTTYTEQQESEIVELFMLNEDDRDEMLKAHYRQGKIVDGKWVNDEEEEECPEYDVIEVRGQKDPVCWDKETDKYYQWTPHRELTKEEIPWEKFVDNGYHRWRRD